MPLRILSAPGKRAQAAYAMRVTQQVVPFFSAYFGLPYALPKLDQLAVPSVRVGAMEDWGLISYSENSLLFDPAKSSPRTQRGVFNTVAHEIAHQWFGNLVTAASWEEIWLNEAFATWLADKAMARFNPAWHTRLEQRLPADRTMAGDAGAATRAIRSGPVSEGSVFDVFDDITYVKGGAVLGMLEQWIGAAPFRAGLAAYMHERRVFQRHGRRPVAPHGAGVAARRGGGGGELDRSARLPAAAGGQRVRRHAHPRHALATPLSRRHGSAAGAGTSG